MQAADQPRFQSTSEAKTDRMTAPKSQRGKRCANLNNDGYAADPVGSGTAAAGALEYSLFTRSDICAPFETQ